MGRLDIDAGLINVDNFEVEEEIDFHPDIIEKNTRRLLEDRLEDIQLEKTIREFYFDVRQ